MCLVVNPITECNEVIYNLHAKLKVNGMDIMEKSNISLTFGIPIRCKRNVAILQWAVGIGKGKQMLRTSLKLAVGKSAPGRIHVAQLKWLTGKQTNAYTHTPTYAKVSYS